ncbi:biopolymer transporter ExbB [Maritimibacter sp. 55A14]|uniref:biopolymer transporter ExbB n=1 Tax=Maritimibacter sp. 55A14 TaxID=2174844 RepID=UPI000D609FE0|nr:biopolymer transporter ExbB [Maritimibacter sp. 55A14]PWE32149.1 biopolymer transporter ExbB [Maritimibacter sp. 55A14]
MAPGPQSGARAHFTQPVRQIMLMLIVLGLVAAGAYIAYPRVAPVFLANPWLNGVIAGVFVVGVLACFWQVLQLTSCVSWIESFAMDRPGSEFTHAPRLLAPLAALLRSRGARMQISSSSAQSLLDSVATRLDEARDITRYIVNLLIFLGLLGTFYGLATTVPAVVDTIQSLNLHDGESGVAVFGRLMSGLEVQLGGMGTAFASSLLGLAGSLVVGLLELFAGHGQNRFYRELEEWVSTITRLGLAGGDGEAGFDQGALAGVLDHMAVQMDSLQTLFERADGSRAETDARIGQLTDAVERMVEQIGKSGESGTGAALTRIAEGQEKIAAALDGGQGDGQVDAESRMRLRSIDVQLLRILEEMSAGRQESMAELRGDLAALTKALRRANRDSAEREGLDAGRQRS